MIGLQCTKSMGRKFLLIIHYYFFYLLFSYFYLSIKLLKNIQLKQNSWKEKFPLMIIVFKTRVMKIYIYIKAYAVFVLHSVLHLILHVPMLLLLGCICYWPPCPYQLVNTFSVITVTINLDCDWTPYTAKRKNKQYY